MHVRSREDVVTRSKGWWVLETMNGKTTNELFLENTKELVSIGFEWIKRIKQIMVVITFIVTILLASVLTPPAEYN